MPSASSPLLGTVLITGGCGFLGYELVRQLLQDPECGRIIVIDRDITKNKRKGLLYIQCDLSAAGKIKKVVSELQPTVIFHLASPTYTAPLKGPKDFFQTNVRGTEALLKIASSSSEQADGPSLRAFVHCSSVDAYADPPHPNADETQPLCVDWHDEPYAQSKALADELVLAANSRHLATVVLRPTHMYGARCTQQLKELLDMSARGGALGQLGDGKNMCSVVSVENTAIGHVLAAKALLDPSRARGKVAGESFNLAEPEAVPFWYHTRLFWSTARGKKLEDADLYILPAWLARLGYALVRWSYWIFTLGRVLPPPTFGNTTLSYMLEDRVYDGSKARDVLGFRPLSDHDAVIREAVLEDMQRRQAAAKQG